MYKAEIHRFYTTKDLCDYFGVTRQAVSRWIKEGKIKVGKTPSGRVRVSEQQFDEIKKTFKEVK